MQGRFKDYIAMPKFNLYQSLHTTVVGPQGKPLEVQIRTREMHHRAEYGIAAHWGYKEHVTADDIAWLKRIVDWQSETSDPAEFMETLKLDLEQDEVFVFTPKGDVITLPVGADADRLRLRDPHRGRPPLHRRAGQRSAGRRSTRSLQSGDTVEIFTSKVAGRGPVARLAEDRRHARAPATRSASGSRRERREDAIENGRDDLIKALRREGLPVQKLASSPMLLKVAEAMNYADLDALHAAIGESHVSAKSVAQRLARELRGGEHEEQLPSTVRQAAARPQALDRRRARRGPRRRDGAAVAVLHAGAGRRDHRLRHPRPRRVGAPGRLRQRGVARRRPARRGSSRSSGTARAAASFVASIEVKALDRSKLLRDVSTVLSDHHVNILQLQQPDRAPTASPRCASTSSSPTRRTSTRCSPRSSASTPSTTPTASCPARAGARVAPTESRLRWLGGLAMKRLSCLVVAVALSSGMVVTPRVNAAVAAGAGVANVRCDPVAGGSVLKFDCVLTLVGAVTVDGAATVGQIVSTKFRERYTCSGGGCDESTDGFELRFRTVVGRPITARCDAASWHIPPIEYVLGPALPALSNVFDWHQVTTCRVRLGAKPVRTMRLAVRARYVPGAQYTGTFTLT